MTLRPRLGVVGLVAVVAVVGVADAARAQGGPWERQVHDKLRRAAHALTDRGFRPSGAPRVGLLVAQASDSFAVTLAAGHAYALIGVCDDDCSVVELRLYGPGDNEVAAERITNVPIVSVAPAREARYRLQVTMSSCRMNPCWYGLAVQTRSPP